MEETDKSERNNTSLQFSSNKIYKKKKQNDLWSQSW